ncbi:MAG: L,D-transpeptidase, partial [Hungatella sp.]
ALTYKERNATLKGENYATPVSYWMPFNGNIGMHDAGWRSSFGGSIYKTGGSHGCVNLPPAAAKTIFENIEKGIPVLCYYLEGTEAKPTPAPTPPPTTAAPTPLPTTAAPTTAASIPETTAAPSTTAKPPEGPGQVPVTSPAPPATSPAPPAT